MTNESHGRTDDAAHDARVSSGTPDETATTSDADGDGEADTVYGALSPGSTATESPTSLDG